MACPNELLDLYFKKYEEFKEADDQGKTKLKPELQSLQKCIDNMWGFGA